MELLGGMEEITLEKWTYGKEETSDELKEEDIKKALNKMKLKKAAYIDGIPMEVWINAGEAVWRELVEIIELM